MTLSDADIHRYIEDGSLVLIGPNAEQPFEQVQQVQPSSIDLRLDNRFVRYKDDVKEVNIKNLENVWDMLEIASYKTSEPVLLPPRSVLFGQIYEQLKMPSDCYGRIIGRSRFARLGLSIHATGDYINPDFEGAMPLQLINHSHIPMVLYPFISICQLVLTRISSKPLIPYPQRADNPYMREKDAGFSVLHTDPAISVQTNRKSIRSEAERRLVERYIKEMHLDQQHKTPSIQHHETIMGNKVEFTNSGTITSTDSQLFVGAFDTVSAKLAKGDSAALLAALREIKDSIAASRTLNSEERQEYVDVLTSIGAEVSSKKPNKTIVRGLAEGLLSAIKVIPDLAKATEAIQTVLIPLLT